MAVSRAEDIFTIRITVSSLVGPPVAAVAPASLSVMASSAPSLSPVGTSGAAAGAFVAAVQPFPHPVGDSRGLLCPPLPCAVLRLSSCRQRARCSAAVHDPGHVDLINYFFRHFGVGGLHWVDQIRSPEL